MAATKHVTVAAGFGEVRSQTPPASSAHILGQGIRITYIVVLLIYAITQAMPFAMRSRSVRLGRSPQALAFHGIDMIST